MIEDTVNFLSLVCLKRENKTMHLTIWTDAFDLNLVLDKGKGATWHADDGGLVMGGIEDPHRRTV